MSNGGTPQDATLPGLEPVAPPVPIEEPRPELRRTRSRARIRSERRNRIAQRVIDFYQRDLDHRQTDRGLRLNRYAKFRQWTSGRSFPWPDASDVPSPDIPTSVLRTEDTLHNAVMGNRPAVVTKALDPSNEEKQQTIDDLHDYQLFVEQPGEKVIEEMVDQFVKEGMFTAYVPWIREHRKIAEKRLFPPVTEGRTPTEYFTLLLSRVYPDHRLSNEDDDDWDFTVEPKDDEPFEVSFYVEKAGDEVEMVVHRTVQVFDGPRVLVKAYDEVLTPTRVANLQAPCPSNPKGSPHVILVDKVTVDEVRRLRGEGFYDLLTMEEAKGLGSENRDTTDEESARQKDIIQGQTEEPPPKALQLDPDDKDTDLQRTLTRLTCFDLVDFDGDGESEDMVFWVLLEPKLLLRARHLTEDFPSDPPRRPFAEATFLPIHGRREGIGLIELLEPLADWKKVVADLMMDSGSITNMPFFFYRPASGLNPETYRPEPGTGIPVSDPRNDVNFPNFNNSTQAWAVNLMAMIQQMEERLDLIGDLQLGRVPAGKSSALRTVGGIQTILAQSEARPERILRRFFMGLVEVHRVMHSLNSRFLQPKKQFRVQGPLPQNEDPYRVVEDTEAIRGQFQFDFEANTLNASKQALLASLESLMGLYVNEVSLGFGILQPEGYYNMLRDVGKAVGQQPDKYLSPPSPAAKLMKLTAEQAILQIAQGATIFDWAPLEGAEVHIARIEKFVESEQLGNLSQAQVGALQSYIGQMQELQKAEQAAQRVLQGAQKMQSVQGGQGEPVPGPAQPGQSPVNENELLPEDLPTSGGGAAGAF